ncbi:MAG: hypothetical protein FWF51_02435 [Chitinivibrionia bacterium]|jgi:hypothetical protein|nr:hypothetical protein [Chitinivibrionia bacterium]
MEYLLNWQTTVAVFVVAIVMLWFLSSVVNFARPIAILVAAGIAMLARYYWWMVDTRVSEWMRFMGLEAP